MSTGETLVKRALAEMDKEHPDLAKTFSFLERAAAFENPEALYAIGTWYVFGKYVKQDIVKGVSYFKRSARYGYVMAYADLGIAYESGKGTRKNLKKTFECYLSGALEGNDQCYYEVGRCFYYGIGIKQDRTIARIWLNHAEKKGIT